MWSYIKSLFKKPVLEDLNQLDEVEGYDPLNNKCDGGNVTQWEYCRPCVNCLKFSTFNERMTDICLGCGTKHEYMSLGFPSSAYRKIFYKGKWRVQLKMNNENYIDGEQL